jgi:3-isopropylmalate/(R)-2-methylmalate dehydratase large subunit
MSIEMGARGGLIAPDEITFNYIRAHTSVKGKKDIEVKIKKWKSLKSDPGVKFDQVINIEASEIKPMITFGTNPGMAIPVEGIIPVSGNSDDKGDNSFVKSLAYMGFKSGEKISGHKVDYIFLGSCTNGRIEDFRAFASIVNGRKKAPGITALLVPGSKLVEEQIKKEGLDHILKKSGFELRQPGCSSCLAMNEDKIPAGKYSVSTSNRNFEGRQGPGARTLLASPLTAAASAITGMITDPTEFLNN